MPANLGFLGLSRLAKPLTGEEGLKILERDHYRCQYCGLDGLTSFENSLIMSVDFIQPRAHKGKKEPENLVTACRPCNRIKGSRVFANLMTLRITLSSAGRNYELNGKLPWINSVVGPPKLSQFRNRKLALK
jgi:hypothetical protein